MTREEAEGYAAEYQPGEPMGDLARALLAALDDLDAVKANATFWENRENIAVIRAEAAEAANAAMTERNKALMGALADLDKVASEVARLGAVPGAQWSRLTVASLRAHAVLRANATDASEGER